VASRRDVICGIALCLGAFSAEEIKPDGMRYREMQPAVNQLITQKAFLQIGESLLAYQLIVNHLHFTPCVPLLVSASAAALFGHRIGRFRVSATIFRTFGHQIAL